MLARWFHADEVMNDHRGWAFNLAVFRIIFLSFAVLPSALGMVRWTGVTMPGLPLTVWAPVSFYRALPLEVISNSAFAHPLALADVGLIVMGILGIWTRCMLTLATLVSVYLFGLVENQGKIDHFHFLVWFMAILAVGPSGHFLSVDSWVHAVRSADQGSIDAAAPQGSGLWALRYVWLLMGLIYLFPGLAKLESALTRGWATGGNVQGILYEAWFKCLLYSPGCELPWPRVDTLPAPLLTTAAIVVILFEIAFIALVLFRPLRPAAFLGGVAFHLGNGWFMGIWFKSLLIAYVCLVDWTGLARTLWRRVDGTRLLVLYDGACGMCRRTVALLRSIDALDALDPVPADRDDPRRGRHPHITDDMLARDMYAMDRELVTCGYDAYVQMAKRIPLLWPLVPVMKLPFVVSAGRLVYRRVAHSRTCSLVPNLSVSPRTRGVQLGAVHWVGGVLIALEAGVAGGMLGADFSSHHLSTAHPARRLLEAFAWRQFVWPFDVFPTFANTHPSAVTIWEARVVLVNQEEVRLDAHTYAATFGSRARPWQVMRGVLSEPDQARHRMRSQDVVRALWRNVSRDIAEHAVAIRIYHVRYRLGPAGPQVLSQELLHVLEVPP
jgi:predicted DCC family thiol-disulfide oxidoreductase YuxK